MADENVVPGVTDETNKAEEPSEIADPKPVAESTADAAGGDTPSGGEKTFSQADVDRIVGQVRGQSRADTSAIEEKARAEVRRELEEKQLLKDKNFEELAERRTQEAADAVAALEKYQHIAKVDELLDKREITDPELRAMFRKIPGELTDLDVDITAHRKAFDAAVDAAVSKRLDVSTPPKAQKETEPKQIKDMTPEEWQAEKEKRGISTG